MRWLNLINVSALLCVALFGCTTKQVEQFVIALAKVPFVDRTEKEINDWFDNRTIIDDKPMTSGAAINGDPRVLLIHEGPKLNVNGTPYPGVICITQTNTLPGGQTVKYAALAGIKVLNNPNLFECGEMDLSEKSCDGDPMAVNVAFHDKSTLEKAFRNAVNQWLKDDIVKTLKSTTNKEGFANPAAAQPRLSAKAQGSLYNVLEDKGPPVVRTIAFFAQ